MTKTMRGPLLAAVVLLTAAVAVRAQQSRGSNQPTAPAQPQHAEAARPTTAPMIQPQAFAWWKSAQFKKELGLTPEQSARIDKIWETTRPELRQEADELSRLEDKLSRLIQNDSDETVLARQIDRVETARAAANKTRSLMLVQMLKSLTPDQRSRFQALNDRWQKELQQPPPADPRRPRQDH